MSSKREDILDAALALFAEKGFHGTAMPDLADVAQVGIGTIYRHFENKEAVVNALYQYWKLQLRAEVYDSVAGDQPWRARFRELWQRLFAFDAAHPGVIAFLDLNHHGGYLDDQSQAIEAQSAAGFFQMVLEAQAQEMIVDLPPAVVIAMVYGAFLGIVRAAKEGYVDLTPDLVATTEERVWALIRR